MVLASLPDPGILFPRIHRTQQLCKSFVLGPSAGRSATVSSQCVLWSYTDRLSPVHGCFASGVLSEAQNVLPVSSFADDDRSAAGAGTLSAGIVELIRFFLLAIRVSVSS